MKILVAGGSGYVGSVLVPKLVELGHEVLVVDLFWFGNYIWQCASVLKKDVLELLPEEVEGYEQVIFLAGLSNDPMAEFSPSKNFIYNAAAPAYLAYLSKLVGVRRFIYASSCSVYGYSAGIIFDEIDPPLSQFPYGISKLQGEQAVLQMREKKFSVISLRKGTISGYSPRMRMDLIVNTMYRSAIKSKKIIVNNPNIWRPVLSMQDTVDAYLSAVNLDYKQSGVFNIASVNCRVGETAVLVKLALQGKGIFPEIETHNRLEFRSYRVSTEAATRVLGFTAKQSIKDIIDDLYYSGLQDLDDPNYHNINVFREILEPVRRS